jgi:DNA-binding response OmpR family regulator
MTSGGLLIVEDEMLIAMQVEDVLAEAGYDPLHLAASVGEALTLIDNEQFGGALLDISLAGEPVWPVADALAARSIPFILCSGGSVGTVPDHHAHVPMLAKPYQREQLLAKLAGIGLTAG